MLAGDEPARPLGRVVEGTAALPLREGAAGIEVDARIRASVLRDGDGRIDAFATLDQPLVDGELPDGVGGRRAVGLRARARLCVGTSMFMIPSHGFNANRNAFIQSISALADHDLVAT